MIRGRLPRIFASVALLAALSFSTYSHAQSADETAALNEIAEALIVRVPPDQKTFGRTMIDSLPKAADGKPLLGIYFAPDPVSMEKLLSYPGRWYTLENAHAVSPTLQAWALETYNRELPQIHFVATSDPATARIYMNESRFTPRSDNGPRRPENSYQKVAANTVHLLLRSRGPLAFINVNSEGNPWFKKAIDSGRGEVVRATLLNELFNALGIKDFQKLDESKLSAGARVWLESHRDHIDDYTITRSGGAKNDEFLKPLDRIILAKLFH